MGNCNDSLSARRKRYVPQRGQNTACVIKAVGCKLGLVAEFRFDDVGGGLA